MRGETLEIKVRRPERYSEAYARPLKVSVEVHERVKQLADKTNRNISEIGDMLVEWALDHVVIVD